MLLGNLELSIKRGVDIDLWKHAFYNFISIMNQNVKDPKVTKQAYFLQSIPCVSGGIISVQTIKKVRSVLTLSRPTVLGCTTGLGATDTAPVNTA